MNKEKKLKIANEYLRGKQRINEINQEFRLQIKINDILLLTIVIINAIICRH